MDAGPEDQRASRPTGTQTWRSRPTIVAALLAGIAAVVVAIAMITGGDGGTTDGGATDRETTDDETPGQDVSEPSADEAANASSAARGAEGTRSLAGVPDEIPAAILTDDATDVEGTVARGGDDWSAVVTYRSMLERDEVEAIVEAATSQAGFSRRQAAFDEQRKVVEYDGADGSVLTVTLRDDGASVAVGVVLLSP